MGKKKDKDKKSKKKQRVEIELDLETPTKEQYFDKEEAVYSEERAALHAELVEKALEGKKPLEDGEPYLLMIGGGYNVGKNKRVEEMIDQGVITDDVVLVSNRCFRGVPEFDHKREVETVQHAEKTALLRDEYFDLMAEIVEEASRRGLSIVLQDHGENIDRIEDVVEIVQHAGYETALMGLCSDFDQYMEQAEGREKEEKNMDHARALASFRNFSQNWKELQELFDYGTLYFRTPDEDIEAVDFEVHGDMVEEEVHDPERYARFKRQKEIEVDQSLDEAWPKGPLPADDPSHIPADHVSPLRRHLIDGGVPLSKQFQRRPLGERGDGSLER